jgi:hypothetical protein
LHRAMGHELHLFMELVGEYVPPEGYEYSLPGEDGMLIAEDFDGRVDVVPVSDPNIVSAVQRIAQSQAILDLAAQQPQMYDIRAVHLNMLSAMRIQNADQFIPPEMPIPATDPVTENEMLLTGKPTQAYKEQLHDAHLIVHSDLLRRLPTLDSVGAKGSTKRAEIEQAALSHMAEHMALKMRVEFEQALMQQGVMLPDQEVPPEVEQQISVAAASAAQSLSPEPGPDPAVVEAEKKALIMEQQAQADARRKDQVAASEIERKNSQAAADIARQAADQEARLLREFISDQAKQTLDAQQGARPSPPVV